MESRLVLQANTVLDGSYRILRVVGSGGFGVTYEAEDMKLGTMVAIKEYYPFDFGDRDSSMSVRPKSQRHKKTFDWGRANFLEEARTLARFEHPSIVRVTRVFEANDTAYMVMRYEKGPNFEVWLKSLKRPPTQEQLDAIAAPLLDALEIMHAANFLHRDIAPDNIVIRGDGTPVLLDFGAARRAVAEMSRSLTGIVKVGYSPHEQYSSDNRLQGPWSDLYALGGTLYRAVAGKAPEEATLRFDTDQLAPAAQLAKGKYRPSFLAAIDACLSVKQSERPQSVRILRPMLLGSDAKGNERLTKPDRAPLVRLPTTEKFAAVLKGSRSWTAAAAIMLVLLAGVYGGFQYRRWNGEETGTRPNGDAGRAAAQSPAPVAPPPAGAAPAKPPTLSDAEGSLRFDQPIPFGPYPVNGRSIKELIEGVPLFPPIEGLDEALWKKTCSSCHKWDRTRLCEQGKTYAKSPKDVLRHPHPYGGTLKLALLRWAKSGCE